MVNQPTNEQIAALQGQPWFDRMMSDAIKEAERRQRSKTAKKAAQALTFADFKRRYWPGYRETPYDPMLDEALQGVADYITTEGQRGISRLMIFMPPRHGKTYRVSRLFPAYMMGIKPDLNVIATSYGMQLARKNSHAVRRILRSAEYQAQFPGTRLETEDVGQWDTTESGGLLAAGVLSAIVGFGAKLIIADDLIKSRVEAESQTYRDRLSDWWESDLLTRLENPGGGIIYMATRYQHDDQAGRLLAAQDEQEDDSEPEVNDRWHVVSLPALAEDNDPLGREPGAALWPERYGVKWIEKRRAAIGDYAFSALYQQRPTPRGEGVFEAEQLQVIDVVPPLKRVVRFYDLAVSAKTRADYTATVKLGETEDGRFVILNVQRWRATPAVTAERIVENAINDGKAVDIFLEAENSARVQFDFLIRDERMRPYSIELVSPEGDKYTRATPVSSRVNAGVVLMVRGAWNRPFRDELALFPVGANDDQVDALSGAYDVFSRVHKATFGPVVIREDGTMWPPNWDDPEYYNGYEVIESSPDGNRQIITIQDDNSPDWRRIN